MVSKIHKLHSAKVSNNCPECYSTNGLEFTFSQEEVGNKLYSYIKKGIDEELICKNCQQIIYPVNWTEDIERVHAYNKKLAKPLGRGFRLTQLGWVLVITDALIFIALVYYIVAVKG